LAPQPKSGAKPDRSIQYPNFTIGHPVAKRASYHLGRGPGSGRRVIVAFATSPSYGGSSAGAAGSTGTEYKRDNNGGYSGSSDCSINRLSNGGLEGVWEKVGCIASYNSRAMP
jgi:hypothetical protein